MGLKSKIIIGVLAAIGILAGAVYWLSSKNIEVLNPRGTIADQQRDLIVMTTALMLVIVLPVFVMTAVIAWRYREGNKAAKYTPDWDHNRAVEFLWWALPMIIITILSVVAWRSSHDLDPFKPLSNAKEPVDIQAVALQWRWLFIYPEEGVASLNQVLLPTDRPVTFTITADAPMNSFWIPQLGGQIYAMPGMSTKLHLMSSQNGEYRGTSANLSGSGFARMQFAAKSVPEADFSDWVDSTQHSDNPLDFRLYNELAQPTIDPSIVYFSEPDSSLYSQIIAKYMLPGRSNTNHTEAGH